MRYETTQTIRWPLDSLGRLPELAAVATAIPVFRLLCLRASLRALYPRRFLALPSPWQLIAAAGGGS